jgi:hypothetical protein
MSELIPTTAPNEIRLDCSALPPDECADLVAFLREQPEIQSVDRVLNRIDAAADTLTWGLTQHVEYAIHLVKEAAGAVSAGAGAVSAVLVVMEKTTKWLNSRKKRSKKCVQVGSAVKIVAKDKPPRSK